MKVSFAFERLMVKHGTKEAIRKARNFGFDAVDYSFCYRNADFFNRSDEDFKNYFTDIKNYAHSLGIEIGQTHSCFPTWRGDESDENSVFLQIQCIKATAHLGSKYVVVHPQFDGHNEKPFDKVAKERNMKFYSSLLPTLKEYGVVACIENMWGWDKESKKICPTVCSYSDELIDYVDTLNDEHFAICHDVGHTNLINYGEYKEYTPENEVRKLKGKLATLHVHDTDGVSDLHTLPYVVNSNHNRTVNWENYCKTLKEIGFDGIMNMETGFPEFFGEEVEDAAGAFAYQIARKLAKMIEND